MKIKTTFEQLVQLHHYMANAGLVYGTSGNASWFDRDHKLLYIKASGYRCDMMKPENIVILDVANWDDPANLSEGKPSPSTDLPIHQAVYEADENIECVAHTHSVHATAFSVYGRKLPVYTTGTAELFGTSIPCVEIEDDKGNLRSRQDISDVIGGLVALGNYRGLLLERHGALVCGENAFEVLNLAEALEWSAQIAMNFLHPGAKAPMEEHQIRQHQAWHKANYGQKRKLWIGNEIN